MTTLADVKVKLSELNAAAREKLLPALSSAASQAMVAAEIVKAIKRRYPEAEGGALRLKVEQNLFLCCAAAATRTLLIPPASDGPALAPVRPRQICAARRMRRARGGRAARNNSPHHRSSIRTQTRRDTAGSARKGAPERGPNTQRRGLEMQTIPWGLVRSP